MRPADRLFQIIQILRRARAPITARRWPRSWRPRCDGLPRRGRADRPARAGARRGGHRLHAGERLRHAAADADARTRSRRWCSAPDGWPGRGDPALARAADDLVAKIGAVIPLAPASVPARRRLDHADRRDRIRPDSLDIGRARAAIRGQTKIRLPYCDETDRATERTVWPVAIAYYETVRLLAAWCELRQDFRHFRTDRVTPGRVPRGTPRLSPRRPQDPLEAPRGE